jgi:hypothetical protein
MKKKYSGNAERQAAYRKRFAEKIGVTPDQMRSFARLRECIQLRAQEHPEILLGDDDGTGLALHLIEKEGPRKALRHFGVEKWKLAIQKRTLNKEPWRMLPGSPLQS